MKPIQFRGKETMSYNKAEPQMNSHPDEIKWNGVDYVKKELVNQEVEKRIAERMSDDVIEAVVLSWAPVCHIGETGEDVNANVREEITELIQELRSRLTPQVTPQDTHQEKNTER